MTLNGDYLIKYKGRRYYYHCNKKNKLDAYKEGKILRMIKKIDKYVVLKGRKYGWNLYIRKY